MAKMYDECAKQPINYHTKNVNMKINCTCANVINMTARNAIVLVKSAKHDGITSNIMEITIRNSDMLGVFCQQSRTSINCPIASQQRFLRLHKGSTSFCKG